MYGKVLDVVHTRDPKVRGTAFIVFRDLASSTSALRGLDGEGFFGKQLVSPVKLVSFCALDFGWGLGGQEGRALCCKSGRGDERRNERRPRFVTGFYQDYKKTQSQQCSNPAPKPPLEGHHPPVPFHAPKQPSLTPDFLPSSPLRLPPENLLRQVHLARHSRLHRRPRSRLRHQSRSPYRCGESGGWDVQDDGVERAEEAVGGGAEG